MLNTSFKFYRSGSMAESAKKSPAQWTGDFFADRTGGHGTYGAGRFLYGDGLPVDSLPKFNFVSIRLIRCAAPMQGGAHPNHQHDGPSPAHKTNRGLPRFLSTKSIISNYHRTAGGSHHIPGNADGCENHPARSSLAYPCSSFCQTRFRHRRSKPSSRLLYRRGY